jgi:hypothetical protein
MCAGHQRVHVLTRFRDQSLDALDCSHRAAQHLEPRPYKRRTASETTTDPASARLNTRSATVADNPDTSPCAVTT